MKYITYTIVIFSLSVVGGQEYHPFSMDDAVAVAIANHPVDRNTSKSAQASARSLKLDEFAWQVKAAYMDAAYYRQRLQNMQEHAHYFEALISLAEAHLFANDSITELAKVSAGARYASYQKRLYIAEEEVKRSEIRLRQIMYMPNGKIELDQTELVLYQIHPDKPFGERLDPVKHDAFYAAQLEKIFVKLVKAKAYEIEYRRFVHRQHIESLKSLLNEYFVQISFCKENLLVEAKLTLEEIENDFAAGRIINYAEAFTKVSNAVYAKLEHLKYISLYNHTALELEYFTY